MIAPITGKLLVTQLFGGRPALESYKYWTGTNYINVIGHTGIDFNALVGTPVFAVYNGIITVQPFQRNGLGNWVTLIDDRGVEVDYGHLSSILYKTGQHVTPGTKIALSGATGNVTGPHLHVQCRNANYNIYNGYLGYHDFITDFNIDVTPLLDLSLV